MKNLFIAGNWKSNKTSVEASAWMTKYASNVLDISSGGVQVPVVICVPYTILSTMKQELRNISFPLLVGAQNISKFDEGAYTGEVTGKMIKEFADWVVIGHSERRKYFSETDADLALKLEKAHAAGLKVIFCVPDDTTPIPKGADVVAYEPVWAIGTGKTDSPENANAVVASIKSKSGATIVLYGGSVTGDNVASFVSQPSIDGVLPGGASMDPDKFSHLVHAAIAATR
jgi:triosephosphate isomerase (TIM)